MNELFLKRVCVTDLNINGVGMCSSFEKIIGGPANGHSGILQLTFHESTKLKNAP